ncbi:TPA: hypothetical protein ACGCD9_003044 [Stenotrophomonas maltophilia]
MSTPYPNLKPVLVELRLDEVDSRGGAAAEMIAATARPIALSISPELMWYSFVLNDRAITRIAPGTRARGHAGTRAHCTISFVNHDGAKEVFRCGTVAAFGDGSSTRGLIRIIRFD